MKKQLFGFLFLLSLVFGISAQKAQVAKPDPVEQNLRKHVSYLASGKLEGRRTGEKGANFAAAYEQVLPLFPVLCAVGHHLVNGAASRYQG